MRVLIYKRTHNGDPGPAGCFGIHDCMGQFRGRDYGAVIGVGGIGSEPKAHGIDGKVNWIGIGPDKTDVPRKRGPEVTFDHFLYFGSDGSDFCTLASNLAKRIYSKNIRVLMIDLSEGEHPEVKKILDLADGSPPSSCRVAKPDPALRPNQCAASRQTKEVDPNEGITGKNRCR